jgi:hypothetical protein
MATNGTVPTGDLLQAPSGVTRVNYFYGQLLTQRDLQTEQCYQVLLRRLMQREAFGTGTVAGLNVQPVGVNGPGSVYVRAGFAIDPQGRELLLTNDACVTLAAPALANGTAYLPTMGPNGAAVLAPLIAQAWGVSFGPADIYNPSDPACLYTRLLDAGLTVLAGDQTSPPNATDTYPNLTAQLNLLTPAGFSPTPGQLLRDVLFNQLVGTTYLGLRYYERGTEPSPTVLDASCCGNAACFPARQEEGVVIVASQTPFPPIPDAYRFAKDELGKAFLADQNLAVPPDGAPEGVVDTRRALCDYLLRHWHGLPPSDSSCIASVPLVVPLASVYWFRFNLGGSSRILLVDNYTTRPLAPGVPQLRALYDVSTQDVPTLPVHPRFDLISPANNQALTMNGATAVVVTAQANTLLATPTPTTWEIYFYPAYTPSVNPPPPPVYWNSTNQPAASYGFTIGVTAAADPTDTFSIVSLTFTNTAVGNALYLPSGTYLWRLNVGGGIDAAVTGAPLDGGPNPPNAVPSGGNDPGGVNEAFEALFYV